MVKIGIIAPPWLPVPPRRYGGVESFIDVLARTLKSAGHQVVLAASSDSSCPVQRIPGLAASDPATMGLTVDELAHVLRAYEELDDVDVILDNTMAGPVVAGLPSAADAIPVAVVAHGPFTPVTKEIYLAVPPRVAIVAISQKQADLAAPVRTSRVIHHGIDLDQIPVGDGGPRACFVGRMSPTKGVAEAIRIAERAGIQLDIAAKLSEPAEVDYFESVVQPMLGPNARYLGELGPAEKYAMMGRSCALLNPIQWDEPFGLVMIEALATGTPVIATPYGSVPEIVIPGRNGAIAQDEEGLAQALKGAAALDRSECRASVERGFSATRMAADYTALFEELIGARPPIPITAATLSPLDDDRGLTGTTVG